MTTGVFSDQPPIPRSGIQSSRHAPYAIWIDSVSVSIGAWE
jgi:hypothetical protein